MSTDASSSNQPAVIPGSSPATLDAPERGDLGRASRVGIRVMLIGIGGLLLWAAFAPLDEGVPTPGIVSIDTKRKPVQHVSGGIVKQVFVHEGEFVKEGQALIQLDPQVARANYEAMRQRYLGLRAVQGRLLAEQAGRGAIDIPPELRGAEADPLIRSQILNQTQLLKSRRAALQADVQSIEENIKGQEGLLKAYGEMGRNRRQQQALLAEELKHTREMVEQGYAPRNRQLELERMVADANAGLAELTGNSAKALHSIAELRERVMLRQQEYRKEVETQLAEVVRDVQADTEKYSSFKADLERTDLKAPAAGQVVGLAVQTAGAVVQAGQKLMDIVPDGEALLLETHIAPHLIDHVHVGLQADVRFSAFAHSPQLVVQGQVESISRDVLVDQPGGVTYYLARVRVLPEGMKTLGSRQMQAGMPVEVIIRTGERSLLKYLLGPLTKRLAASMKEE